MKPIFIYGAPGIGKTQLVAQAAQELGVKMVNLDIQFMNPEDLVGIPSQHTVNPVEIGEDPIKPGKFRVLDAGTGFSRSNPKINLPQDNGQDEKGGFLFLDEMNRANKYVLNALMQFIQMGRIDTYELPDKWVIVGAGNRQADDPDADIQELPIALADRFTRVNYVPRYEDWDTWASKNFRIMPELVIFLKYNKMFFHRNDPDDNSAGFPSPRSWTLACKELYSKLKVEGLKSWLDLDKEELRRKFNQQVGLKAGTEFMTYLDVLRVIDDHDISVMISNPEKAKFVEQVKGNASLFLGLGKTISSRLTKYSPKNLYNILVYMRRYDGGELLGQLYSEMCVQYPYFKPLMTPPEGQTPEDMDYKSKAAKMVFQDLDKLTGRNR